MTDVFLDFSGVDTSYHVRRSYAVVILMTHSDDVHGARVLRSSIISYSKANEDGCFNINI